jgi:hypothetical protein
MTRPHLRSLTATSLAVVAFACSGPSAPAVQSPAQAVAVEAPQPEVTSEARQWMVWRPCGCSEGCARVNVASIAEGAEVVVGETWTRENARPLAPGSHVRVESTEAEGGGTVQVLTNLEGVCGYLCQTEFTAPVSANQCAGGHFAPAAEAPSPPAATGLPPCGIRTRSAPNLERYDELVPGARFHVMLTYESNMHAWTPPSGLRMPMHHASAIEYIDYALPPPGPQTIDLEIEGVERVQGRVDERTHTFFFTYRVRVIDACVAG